MSNSMRFITSRVLLLCTLLFTVGVAQADIIDLQASTVNGYVVGSSSEVLISVSFNSSTMEFADIINFSTGSPNVTLGVGSSGSPSPYVGCGLDRGDISTVSGVGWMTPSASGGDSGCGAFRSGETHIFPISVISSGSTSTPITITVTVTGDGNGESTPTVQTFNLSVAPVDCMISCVSPQPQNAGANGMAAVTVPAISTTGTCSTSNFQDYSGDYPIGDTTIAVIANDNPLVSCQVEIVVLDVMPPEITGCDNEVIQLGSGECEAVVNKVLAVGDNGSDVPVAISQNNSNTIDLGISCPGGITTLSRVFNTDDYDIDTELNLSSIEFAVLEASGGQTVTATVSTVDGTYPGGTLTELGSASRNVASGNDFYETIAIDVTVPANTTFVVELTTQGSLFGGAIFGTTFDGETGTSYIEAPFCNVNSPQSFAAAGYAGQALIMNLTGQEKDVIVRQTGDMTYSLGDAFPIGVTTLEYEAVDASGNVSPCNFSVTVNEFQNPVGSLTCNDQVNVSLDLNCRDTIHPDQVLEGDMYGCFNNYTVQIEDDFGRTFGNVVDASMINMNLKVRVLGPNGNSCWGRLLIEDKGATGLVCDTVYTTCTGDLTPGSDIARRVTFLADVSIGSISDGAPSSTTFEVDVFGLVGALTRDVNVVFDIDHDNVSDLAATITSPQGETVALFTSPGTNCAGEGLRLTIDDGAMMSYAELQAACEPVVPAITGQFRSEGGNLSTLNASDPNGTWLITVSDTRTGNGGLVQGISLVLEQSGGTVVFPTRNAVTFTSTGQNQYNVSGIDACGDVTATYLDEVVDQPCTSPYTQIINRTWNAEDEEGNQSLPCTQVIYVFRNDLSTLEFPMNFDGVDGRPTLSCADFGDVDRSNTIVEVPPSATGGGPAGDFCDNVQILDPVDQVIDVCPKSFKIIRRWKIVEWCSGDVIEYNQIIKIEDNQGPQLSCPSDVTMSTGQYECNANHVAVKPVVSFECSDNVTYSVAYLLPGLDGLPNTATGLYETDNVSSFGGSFLVSELPIGTSRIQWTVTDECGNTSTCDYDITVGDETPPIAACDEFTVTSLGSDGIAYVKALTFDDESYDNCSELTYAARKMVDVCGISGTSVFRDEIAFCCEEVGTSVMVEFQVTDASGNSNTCMIEVTIDDKLPPYITHCPADITLNCQADFTDLSITGIPEAVDNCELVDTSYRDRGNLDQCGRGVITRTWTVKDKQGLSANSCVQTITVTDLDPFDRRDIRFPRDYDAVTCDYNLSPDITGRPRISDDICSLTAVDYDDQVFTFVDSSCVKVLRTWTVIDWCTYDPNNVSTSGQTPGLYTEVQIIKIDNKTAPEINEPCVSEELCSFGDCGGRVTISKTATDDCTPEGDLLWEWSLDIDADGDIDRTGSGNSVTVDLDNGEHSITWLVEDKCGNTDHCTQSFTVKDCKKPSPYCRSSVTTVVMPNNGMIDIWASDFNLYSTDNCTPDEELKYSFSRQTSDTRRVFTCDDIINGEEVFIPLTMYVTDNDGNFDFCEVALIVQDGIDNVCDTTTTTGNLTVTGSVSIHSGGLLSTTDVVLRSITGEVETTTVDANGQYRFDNVSSGYDYTINAEKTDGVDDGVSTLDLVLIQRHIIAISRFVDPMSMIAADIDNNDRVTGSDIVALRRLILGITNEMPNGQQSWRFVDASAGMTVDNALPYDETIDINNLASNSSGNDFKAIKIGDINNSATGNLNGNRQVEIRSGNTVTLVVDNTTFAAGEEVVVPVYLDEGIDIAGYQMAMSYAGDALTFKEVRSGQVSVSDADIHVTSNTIKTAFASNDVVVANEDEALYYLVFDAKSNSTLSQSIALDATSLTAELYDENLDIHEIALSLRSDELAVLTVDQNTPNPFEGLTTVSFYTPVDSDVIVEVSDLAGKALYRSKQYYTRGQHSIEFDADDLGAQGILFYTVSNEQQSVTKRMIAIR